MITGFRVQNFKAFKDLQIVNQAIAKIIGNDVHIGKYKHIKNQLQEIKAFFRDLNL